MSTLLVVVVKTGRFIRNTPRQMLLNITYSQNCGTDILVYKSILDRLDGLPLKDHCNYWLDSSYAIDLRLGILLDHG